MWPCLGVEVGLTTTMSPPTVESAAGTPGQYHVVVIGVRCDANGRLANGTAPNMARLSGGLFRPTMSVVNITNATTIGITHRRCIMVLRPRRFGLCHLFHRGRWCYPVHGRGRSR